MEIVRYAIVAKFGDILRLCRTEEAALTDVNYKHGCVIVRLVGQLPEPKRIKKVALFVFHNGVEQVTVGYQLLTEDEAKEKCRLVGYTLIKWPYGEIIEVPT